MIARNPAFAVSRLEVHYAALRRDAARRAREARCAMRALASAAVVLGRVPRLTDTPTLAYVRQSARWLAAAAALWTRASVAKPSLCLTLRERAWTAERSGPMPWAGPIERAHETGGAS